MEIFYDIMFLYFGTGVVFWALIMIDAFIKGDIRYYFNWEKSKNVPFIAAIFKFFLGLAICLPLWPWPVCTAVNKLIPRSR